MKKIILSLVAVAVISAIYVPAAKAYTVEELQAQIQVLLQQVAALQKHLAAQQGETSAFCYTFSQNLRFGDGGVGTENKEQDVRYLQEILEKEGFSVDDMEQKGDSQFLESTAAAVVGFQEKYRDEILAPYKLSRGTGYVGVSTRAKLNKLYGCSTNVPQQPTPAPTPAPTSAPTLAPTTPSAGVGITVIYPNGGEVLKAETQQTLTWNSSNAGTSNVDVTLLDGNTGNYAATIARGIPNTGSYSWSAPESWTGNIEWKYKIQISLSDNPKIWDASNAPFTLVSNRLTTMPATSTQSFINITSPVGGETWKVGETHRIAWKSSNVSNVKLYLYDDRIPSSGAIVAYPAGGNSIPAVQGYYDWAIPNSILQGNDGKHFQIKIQDANDYRLYDSSNGYFTIVSATTAANVSLSYDSSTPVSANTIADSKGVSLVNYRISVNNGVFNLPTITLDLDTSKASVSDISTISIYKSGSLIGRGEFTATGRVVLNLSTIIPNGISQVWEVKADISPSAVPGHQISLGSPNLTFATQAEFNFTQVPIGWSNPMTIISTPSITTPSIIVLSPNGGELWEAGKTYEIKWISSPAGYLVSLSLVKKGETILTHIEGFLSNNNSYYWTAPSNLTIGEYKIMATLSDKIGTFDKSDNYFSIVSAATQSSITVVSPNGGEVWRVGETNVIKWKISGFAEPIDIRIDLYDDINLQTYPIAEVVASPLVDGSFSWAIPSSATTVEGRNLPITPGNKFRIVMFAERTSNGVKQQFRGESGHFTIGSSGIGSNNNGTSANLPLSASVIESMSSALSQLKAIFEGMR